MKKLQSFDLSGDEDEEEVAIKPKKRTVAKKTIKIDSESEDYGNTAVEDSFVAEDSFAIEDDYESD